MTNMNGWVQSTEDLTPEQMAGLQKIMNLLEEKGFFTMPESHFSPRKRRWRKDGDPVEDMISEGGPVDSSEEEE